MLRQCVGLTGHTSVTAPDSHIIEKSSAPHFYVHITINVTLSKKKGITVGYVAAHSATTCVTGVASA